MLEGDSTGRVFGFPIPTYCIDKEFDWNRESLKTVWEMTAKYGIPYFSNFVNSDMNRDDARSMCCRLRLDNRELRKRGGGLFGANPLTGSLGVVTINLARIGYLAKDIDDFKSRVVDLMELAKESLEIKRKIIEKFTEDRLYPYSMYYLDGIRERFGSYWKNHFSTIGLNGMNEAALNLMGKDISTPEGHAFAAEMLDFMRNKLMDFQNETNNLYNLEATPGEGCTYRFAKKDQQLYPGIISANTEAVKNGADPYYTNSTHLHVSYTDDIFSALDLQDDLQIKYTGGTVLHGYLGERLPSGEAAKSLVKKIVDNYRLPYFTITPTFSICPKHGYLAGEHKYCPKCDAEIGYQEKTTDSQKIEA
jgi:ribonucleoside-triphosphate reductase